VAPAWAVSGGVAKLYRADNQIIPKNTTNVPATYYFQVDSIGWLGTYTYYPVFQLTSLGPSANCYYYFTVTANNQATFSGEASDGPFGGYYPANTSGCPELAATTAMSTPFDVRMWISTSAWSATIGSSDQSGTMAWDWLTAMKMNVWDGDSSSGAHWWAIGKYGVSPDSFTWTKTFDTGITTPYWESVVVSSSDPSDALNFYVSGSTDNATWGTRVIVTSGSITGMPATRYLRTEAQFIHQDYDGDPSRLDDFSVVAFSSGVWTSPAMSIGTDITAWSQADISISTDTSSVITWQLGSSTSADTGVYSWTTIANGAIPAVSTNPYAAVRAVYAVAASTQQAVTNSVKINWTEGTLKPPTGFVFDRRYYLAISTIPSVPYNDTILAYQRNNSWTLLKGFNVASFTNWRDSLYFGNSDNTGYVYKLSDGNSLDGSAMTSVLRFKSYDMGAPNFDKEFRRAWAGYDANALYSGSFALSWVPDQMGTGFSLGSADLTESTGQYAAKFPFPISDPVRAREAQFVLTKTGSGNRLKLYDLKAQFAPREAD
jgi:hypothetical protein